MTTSKMRTFLTVCRSMSFTEAGISLGLTSSAVSRQMAALEGETGIRLFNRSNNSIQITDAGRRLRAGLEQIVSDLDKVVEDARKLDLGIRGNLRLGLLYDQVLDDDLSDTLRAFTADRKIDVTIKRYGFRPLYQSLENGELDIAITILQSRQFFPECEKYIFARESMCLALHRKLAEGVSSPLSPEDQERLYGTIPIVSPSLSNFVESQQPFLGLSRSINENWADADVESIVPMTLAGLCGVFVNESNILFRDPNILCLEADGLVPVEKAILWRRDNENPLIARFIEAVRLSREGETGPEKTGEGVL